MKHTTTALSFAGVLVWMAACGSDAVTTDTATPSSAQDSGASAADVAARDTGIADSPLSDSSVPDSNVPDSDIADSNVPDSNVPDSNVPDAHVPDASVPDANTADVNIGGGGQGGTDSGYVDDVRMNEIQVAGTHNSYHVAPLIPVDASHKYTQKPLDQQLGGGVRQLELDLHLNASGTFEVYHLPVIDSNTTCSTLDACLHVIDTWSRAHPTHVPIYLWFEVKDAEGGVPVDTLQPVDDMLVSIFGEGRLITPAWLQKNYASPRARLEAEGWPRLHEARGRIMPILLNDNDSHTQNYTNGYSSLDGRKMFASANGQRLSQPWAVVTKFDPTDGSTANAARANHLLTCANVCSIDKSDADCASLLTSALSIGLNMLSDDLPFPITGRTYYLALPHGSPGCDSVTASPTCDPVHLE